MAGLSTGTPTKTSPYGALQGYGSAVPKTPVDPLLGSPGGQLAPGGAPASAPQATTDWFNTPKAGAAPASASTGYNPNDYAWPGPSETPSEAAARKAAGQQAQLVNQQNIAGSEAQKTAAATATAQQQAAFAAQQKVAADEYAYQQKTWGTQNAAAVEAQRVEQQRQQTAWEALNAAGVESARTGAATAAEAARVEGQRQQAAWELQNTATTSAAQREADRKREEWLLQNQADVAKTSQAQQFSSGMIDKQVSVVKDLMGNTVTPSGTVAGGGAGTAEPALAKPRPLPRVGLGGTTSAAPVYGGGGVSAPGSQFETKSGAELAAAIGPGTPVPPGQGPGGGNPLLAGEAAAWARAKDKIGGQTAGAVKSLKGLQAARGFGGESGVYGDEERQLLGTGLSAMGDVTRGQAEDAAAAARQREALVYQGDITQRGQDLGLTSNTMNIGLGERGQNISSANAAADRQAQLLGSYLSLIKFGAY